MRIVCKQTILIKYHVLFVIFEKAAKFEIVVCQIVGGALWVKEDVTVKASDTEMQSKLECKDHEWIQSSTTPDPRYHM